MMVEQFEIAVAIILEYGLVAGQGKGLSVVMLGMQ